MAISWSDFESIDLRVGTIVKVELFPDARKAAYKLTIDLGPDLGLKRSSAQITSLYTPQNLLGQQVICACNFPPKQIGSFISEVLTTGFYRNAEEVVLAQPQQIVPNGSKLA